MQAGKLFRVLVLFAAPWSQLGCAPDIGEWVDPEEEPENPNGSSQDAGAADGSGDGSSSLDAGAADGSGDGSSSLDAGSTDGSIDGSTDGALTICFCDPASDECCEDDGNGNMSVREGFECCWGTSC